MQPHLTFVDFLPRDATRRERELQLAKARRHAATVAHQRRRVAAVGVRPSNQGSRVHDGCSALSKPGLAVPAKHAAYRLRRNTRCLSVRSDDDPAMHDPFPHETSQLEGSEEVSVVSQHVESLRESRSLSKFVLCSYRMDPLYRIPHDSAVSFYEAVDFFTHTVSPNNVPVYTIFNVSNVYGFTFDLASEDHFLHVFLATMHLIRSMAAPHSQSAHSALKHKGEALKKLQQVISHCGLGVDDYIICSVLFIALLARAYGDHRTHAIHCHYLQRMVEQRGGLDGLALSGITRCAILQWESFWALDTGRSMFEGLRKVKAPVYPSLPLPSELKRRVWALPVGFQRLAYRGKLALDVLELLERTANPNLVNVQLADKSSQWSRAKYDDFWEACACLADPEASLQKYLCLALLLFCTDEYSPRRQFRRGMTVFNGPRALLTRELPMLASNDSAEEECLMWIWMVVVDAWSSDCAIEGQLPISGLQLMFDFRWSFPGASSWDGTSSILRKFFWSKRFSSACKAFCAQTDVCTQHQSQSSI